jgi:hypothetical protein
MLYPGQAVYIPKEKKIGIYISFIAPKFNHQKPDMFVYLGVGKDLSESDTVSYNPEEIIPLAKPDKKSPTGQTMYETPFQRDAFHKKFYDTEAEEHGPVFIEEMQKLLRAKWVKEKYEIDLRSGLEDDEDAGKGVS